VSCSFSASYVPCLATRPDIFPVLDLAVAVHALEGLSKDAQAPRDAAEDRNYRLFARPYGRVPHAFHSHQRRVQAS